MQKFDNNQQSVEKIRVKNPAKSSLEPRRRFGDFLCSVPQCHKNNQAMYSLPKSPQIRDKWLDFLRITGKEIDKDYLHYSVCEYHFESSCFQKSGVVKTLIEDSIPTIIHKSLSNSVS